MGEGPSVPSHVHQVRTVSVLAVAEIAGKVASFAMFAVAARRLGPADFGSFTWSFTLALIASSFVVWGFDTAAIQLASKDLDRLDGLLSSSLGMRFVLSCATLVVITLFPSGGTSTPEVTFIIGAAVLLDAANQSVRAAAAVLDRQGRVAVNLVVQRFVTAAIAIAVLLSGGGVLAMSAAYLVGTSIGVALMMITARRIGLRPSWRALSRPTMQELWRASAALGASNLLNMLVFRMDAILLGWLINSTAVGTYGVAYKVFETALFAVWSLDSVALPQMTATPGDEVIRNGVHRVTGAMMAVYVPYCLILGLRGQEVLTLLFGSAYGTESLASLQILLVALIPYGVQYLVASGLLARRNNLAVTRAAGVAVVVNLGANLALIPRYGASGAAAATLIAMVVQTVVLLRALRQQSGSPRLVRTALVPAVAGIAILPVLLSILGLLPATALSCLVYGVVWTLASRAWDPTAYRTLVLLVSRR